MPTHFVFKALCFACVVFVSFACVAAPPSALNGAGAPSSAIDYPETKTVNHLEIRHGQEIPDPYRWLEEDVRQSAAVSAWVTRQNAVTFEYLEGLPGRDVLAQRLTELWNFERYSVPVLKGDRIFYQRNDGLQDQAPLYVQTRDGEPRLLLDPNTWSEDGTVALSGYWPSPDGARLVYAVQDGGSDWRTLKVVDVDTGQALADAIEWVKFSGVSWLRDGSGFFYSRYPEPEDSETFQAVNYNQAVYLHRIGRDQAADTRIYARADHPEHGFSATVSDDGRFLVITVWRGTDDRYEVLLDEIDALGAPRALFTGFEHEYTFIGNAGTRLLFKTNKDAPRGRVIALDVSEDDPIPSEVIAEGSATLEGVSHVGGRLIAEYLKDAKSAVYVHGLDGRRLGEVALPGLGSVSGFGGSAEQSTTFYRFSSFNRPPTIHRYEVDTGDSSVFRAPSVAFDPDDYVVEQVFYRSKDGTRVPMFLAHRRDVTPNGKRPTLLYGYGGFNIALTPSFSVTRLAWMEQGGVYAVANLRGGGEYGKDWHNAGRLKNKQNVFDDFIAAGEALIERGWTSTEHLGIFGGSNGGLLVGAVLNQRPDLFAAAIPAVGVMDMLRFDQFTAGRFWIDDYGDPGDPEMFEILKSYSPYHNIKDGGDYPAVLVTTADTDDRVVPGHSFKYAARLQARQGGDKPVLIRIETRAGHGSGKPTSMMIEEYADLWAFLGAHTGLEIQAQDMAGR